jgi:hypothetical protein
MRRTGVSTIRVSIFSVNATGARCIWLVPHVEPTRPWRFRSDLWERSKIVPPRMPHAIVVKMKMNAIAMIRFTMVPVQLEAKTSDS